MSTRTAIQYYIPEDGDELEHPNVLLIEKEASTITLGDIRKVFHMDLVYFKAFPIPGTYYFRFKRSFKKNWSTLGFGTIILVWFDVLKDSEVVPSFEGSIICKVTRLPAKAAQFINKSTNQANKKQSQSATKQTKVQQPQSTITKESISQPSVSNSEHQDTEDFFNGFVLFLLPFHL